MAFSDLLRRPANPNAIQPMVDVRQPRISPRAGTLAAVVGTAAAALLLTAIPREESGRKVDVTVADDGTATVKHVAGKQYLKTYLDIAGVATACDGITRGVKRGQVYTEAQCAELLERELVIHATGVMRCTPALHRQGMDYQRVAAVSHGYNFGVKAYCGSTIARQFNAGNTVAACNAFLPWNKARVNGVRRPVKGLTYRRNRERQFCLTNILPNYTPDNLADRLKPWR